MKSNSEIRKDARDMLSGKWGMSIVAGIIIIIAESVISEAGFLITIFAYYPFVIGICITFSHLYKHGEVKIEKLFDAYNSRYYIKSVTTCLLVNIYTFLWTLLLIVPGIIKGLAYSQSTYIISEEPELSAEEAINRSIDMMEGYKMRLFLIMLGEFGLALASMLLLGIPLLWIVPYYQAIYTRFYYELKEEYNSRVTISYIEQ